jgi:hypothetical protein
MLMGIQTTSQLNMSKQGNGHFVMLWASQRVERVSMLASVGDGED